MAQENTQPSGQGQFFEIRDKHLSTDPLDKPKTEFTEHKEGFYPADRPQVNPADKFADPELRAKNANNVKADKNSQAQRGLHSALDEKGNYTILKPGVTLPPAERGQKEYRIYYENDPAALERARQLNQKKEDKLF